MDGGSVTFKGTVNGLTIILKEEENFESILEQIEKKIAAAGKFFKGASLVVKYRGKELTKHEEKKIYDLMVNKSGAEIKSLEKDTEEPAKVQNNPPAQRINKLEIKKFYHFKGIEEGVSKFYRGTVRSGQLVSFDGNLVIIGDVNPGAEVVATGNVIVMGSLRGMVHAGADGNKEAIVVAFNLQPMQLRIADVITRSPDEKGGRNPYIPELAFVKDDMVYIERFLPQYK
ncbi:MAG: septum site-determining protein MinC [Clostridia bacterium]|nr:septum site-determining protein MinC [Clostridia bacterium]